MPMRGRIAELVHLSLLLALAAGRAPAQTPVLSVAEAERAAGRLLREKRWDDAIAAFAQTRKCYPTPSARAGGPRSQEPRGLTLHGCFRAGPRSFAGTRGRATPCAYGRRQVDGPDLDPHLPRCGSGNGEAQSWTPSTPGKEVFTRRRAVGVGVWSWPLELPPRPLSLGSARLDLQSPRSTSRPHSSPPSSFFHSSCDRKRSRQTEHRGTFGPSYTFTSMVYGSSDS